MGRWMTGVIHNHEAVMVLTDLHRTLKLLYPLLVTSFLPVEYPSDHIQIHGHNFNIPLPL